MNTCYFKTKNTHKVLSTFASLNCILRIFGLSAVSCVDSRLQCYPFTFRATCIALMLFTFNVSSAYYLLPNLQNGILDFKFSDSVHLVLIIGFVQYLVDINFVYKYGRESYLHYINRYGIFDESMGIVLYEEVKRYINKLCTIFITIVVTASISEIIIWLVTYNSSTQTFFFLYYLYMFLNLLTELDFIANCTQVLYRLKSIDDKLQDFYSHLNNLPGVYKRTVQNYIIKSKTMTINVSAHSVSRLVHRQNVILLLNRCFLLLTDQCDYINSMFGLRVSISYK